MANHGAGTKFVSVNLNKSYGQTPSSAGTASGSRIRPGSHGAGGGMVVLSRTRSSLGVSQKSALRLSVPPPLNLPSLRKEHERFDSASSGTGLGGGGSSGSGSRPSSSGMGWTKPAPPALQEKDSSGGSGGGAPAVSGGDLPSYPPVDNGPRENSVYVPPSARLGPDPPVATSVHAIAPVQKPMVLRGEDFPSLQATLPATSGPPLKQKDPYNQKQKQKAIVEGFDEQRNNSHSRPAIHMRPQMRSTDPTIGNGSNENDSGSHGSSSLIREKQSWKHNDYFPDPLPVVRLNHRSDWADDERDTGHGVPDRDRDHGFSRSESQWDSEFDIPRGGLPPRTSVHDTPSAHVLHNNESGKVLSGESFKADLYGRDVRTPSREGRDGSIWRGSPRLKDSYGTREIVNTNNGTGVRPFSINRTTVKDTRYTQTAIGDSARDVINNGATGNQDFRLGKKDVVYGQGGKQNGNHVLESFNSRGLEYNIRDRYGNDISNRYRADVFQNNSVPKTSFSTGSRGLPVNDPILNFAREKRSFSNNGKPYRDNSLLKDLDGGYGFDGRDPLSGGLVGVVKRKKDVLQQADFHDPVRESFEAELERVQQMQEQERQRIMEEQSRALELARKEEEERERLAREEEERRRRHEEEAREAAWRAEQERLEAMRRAEEQRVAREEEKRRILLEDERRKEAARLKLLELEARIARRQAEAMKDDSFQTVADERISEVVKEKDIPREADVRDWEDGERMVERITNSASSDSSSMNRSFEMGSRPHSGRDGTSVFVDRGKATNSWRREMFDNVNSSFPLQDQENGYGSPRRDAFGAGRAFSRKEFGGSSGFMSARAYYKGGITESPMDDFSHLRGHHRWNLTGDGDHYSRNSEIDPDFHENPIDKFGEIGWGQDRSRGILHASYPERLYQNSETDGTSSFGRSRHSMRQPRVLPPPQTSMHRSSFRGETGHHGSSAFLNNEVQYHLSPRKSEPSVQTGYDNGYQEMVEQSGVGNVLQQTTNHEEQKLEKITTRRCDSQSSLSVSSPPNSPPHLSHDDLDVSSDSPISPSAEEDKAIHLSDSENVASETESGKACVVAGSGSVSPGEEWTIQNNEELQEQEEYDEENGYHEEDEVHEGDNGNIDLTKGFDDMHLEEKGTSCKMDHLVLGFDDGVEVGLPNDEFERRSVVGEKTVVTQQLSVSAIEEPTSSDVFGCDEQNFHADNSLEMRIDSSSKTFQQTDKEFQDLVIQPMNAPHGTASSDGYPLDGVEISGGSSLLAQLPVTSSFSLTEPSSSAQPVVTSISSVPSQAEVPVNLQFGLFSGPSLIPSPVPAIQIGSIPMPLHLHPQVGPSITQMHPSQPPFFQFGQLRYPSPISQGILPLAPQSMPFNVSAHYSLNQNMGSHMHSQAGQDTSVQNPQVTSISMDDQPGFSPKLLDLSPDNATKGVNGSKNGENEARISQCQPEIEDQRHHNLPMKKNYKSVANNRESQGLMQAENTSSQLTSSENSLSGSKAPGAIYGNKGKKFIYTVRNSGLKMPSSTPEAPRADSSGFQRRPRRHIRRTEFRVRENADSRQTEALVSHNYSGLNDKSNFSERVSGVSARTGAKKNALVSKPPKQTIESESLTTVSTSSRTIDCESKLEKGIGNHAVTTRLTSSLHVSPAGEGKLKRNSNSEEDVDAPLQSGVVRVFNQPGIETPSDEDDFIEVRSKRQMLNDRREQREKEIKAKSKIMKAPRKPRAISQSGMLSTGSHKMLTSLSGEMANNGHYDSVVTEKRGLKNVEISAGFNSTTVPQPLPPFGTPSGTNDAQSDIRSNTMKSLQMGSIAVISGDGAETVTGLPFEMKNVVLDNAQTSLGCWGNARINQQVMTLTQTQLDEAMKPGRLEKHVSSIGDHTSTVTSKQSSALLTQDKSFPYVASPLNSLLAGEKIQFGAVTSPTILPPGSRDVSNGIVPPDSCRPDIPMSHNISVAESDCNLFFKKEKHPDESCVHLEDAEAEAEAAASAIAVAAISSDEIVGSGLGACSVSVSSTKNFGGAEIEGLTSQGGACDQPITSQSRTEESLTVALPADLSVETPMLSLWPNLPSPQGSSQTLTHFPGGPPSHFPCYEMNPMLGAPIFAFGPHDESVATQSQSHKSNASSSGQLGAWQQCHSSVDSFYGQTTGFTGPFISPPSGIPGVQGPPHMVVYNHFAPVGQFGQVGLSFMGTTYIPSGKQPDWKHNPTSTSMGVGEVDISNLNVVSAQHNPSNIPAPVQHLAPGSPLLPMPSPLAMFDMAPFQSSPDMSVQARWSHVPASSLHSVPLSMPLQHQADGILSSQFTHGLSVEQSSTGNKFHEPNSSTTSDNRRNFSLTTDATASQFPDELGLVDHVSSPGARVLTSRSIYSSQNGNGKADGVLGKSMSRNAITNVGSLSSRLSQDSSNCSSSNSSGQNMSSAFKSPSSQHQPSSTQQQYMSPTGYSEQRGGGVSQRAGSGGEWPHRRMGLQGRNQLSGTEKGFTSTKIKQIYVAKSTLGGTSTAA